MADLDQQTEEALGWAAEGKKLAVDIPEVSFKDAATFVASATPIIGDAMAAKEVYDELQKDEPNYYLAGALGGATLVGLVPGLGDAAAKAIKKGAKEVFDVAKRVEVDPNAMGSGLGNVRLAPKQPKKTVKAYKLFTKGKDGKLYPLFVDADTEVPTGTWLDATFPDYRFTAENGKQYVPSRGTAGKKGTGDSIKIPDQETRDKLIEAGFLPKGSKAKSIKAVAARPGWHAGDVPIATHIGPETKINGKSVKYRGEDQVWAEVEMPADVDWQAIANAKARIKKDGTPDVRTADINDEMPSMGHYRYKTNPNMTGEWLIGGEMKVNRVLSREEVNAINEAAGVKDLPTLDELNRGYSKGGVVMDDYQYAEMMQGEEDQTVKAFALGGLAEDVDPVSGNEVPTGSLPEEVRDDIPAQLSEGEYVVPADVVRFFGVKFFEDIRAEAKRGFASMEANGRIGGEPIGIEMGGDELPFDISELQMVDDGEPEQPMMNEGGFISGYAPGGLADTGDLPLTEENYQGTGMQQRQYTNAEGNIITILFFNGMPMSVIPAGYSPYTPEATPTEAKEAVVNDNDDGPPPMQNPEPIDYKALSAEELRGLVEDQKGTNSTAISLGLGMLNPLLGMAFKAASWHQSKQITKELQRRMEDGSLDAKQKAFYTDLTETMTADQPGFFERLFGKTEEEAKKPDVAGTVMTPEEITATVEAALAYSPEEGYVPTGMPPIPAPSPITMKVLDDEPGARDYRGPLAPSVPSATDSGSDASGSTDIFADAASNADAGTAKVVAAAEENLATESEISDIQKEGAKIKEKLESAARGGGRGFSDGGLMKKKK